MLLLIEIVHTDLITFLVSPGDDFMDDSSGEKCGERNMCGRDNLTAINKQSNFIAAQGSRNASLLIARHDHVSCPLIVNQQSTSSHGPRWYIMGGLSLLDVFHSPPTSSHNVTKHSHLQLSSLWHTYHKAEPITPSRAALPASELCQLRQDVSPTFWLTSAPPVCTNR
jgi:hypothetical protein